MFRFSIRDLILVTVIAAVCLGWWMDRRRLAAERDRAVGEYFLYYDYARRQGALGSLPRMHRTGLLWAPVPPDSKPH